MADIEKTIKDIENEIEIINKQIVDKLDIEKKSALIEKKNLLVDKKFELNTLLIQYNNIIKPTTNKEIPYKRKTDNIPECEDMSKSSDEENTLIAKNINGEKKYKKAIKKKDNENNIQVNLIKKINNEKSDLNNYTQKLKDSRKTSSKNNQIKNITEEKIIESFNIGKNYDFNKYNLIYSWLEEEFITTYTKKKKAQ